MLTEKGYVKNTTISNIVRATAAGTIIDLPLKEGASITERNNFNPGTTVAIVARLDTFVFKGKVNETDMVNLRQGMKLKLSFNAYKNQTRDAIVTKISSKGIEEQGIMKYFVEAKFDLKKDTLVIQGLAYKSTKYIIQKHDLDKEFLEIYLKTRINELNEIEVSPYTLTGVLEVDTEKIQTYGFKVSLVDIKNLKEIRLRVLKS